MVVFELCGECMISFYNKLIGYVLQVVQEIGILVNFMIGYVVLEFGWGCCEIKVCDGMNMYNLFGIKVGSLWVGKIVMVIIIEYIGGVVYKVQEKFCVYSLYVEVFKDYVNLLVNNLCYSNVVVVGNGNDVVLFVKGLQCVGYVIDLNYVYKIMVVFKQIV